MDKRSKVSYELCDVSSGAIYIIQVNPDEARALDFDKEKRFRIIKNLQSIGKKPDKVWESLIEESPTQPTAEPAKKKLTVGLWNDAAQWALLDELMPYRAQLRAQRYASDIWAEVANKLKRYNLPQHYSAEQVAEKVRLMKRILKSVQTGKRKGAWDFTDLMETVFERPIVENDEGPAQCSFVGSYNSYVNGMQPGAHSSFRGSKSTPEVSPTTEHGSRTQGSTLSILCNDDFTQVPPEKSHDEEVICLSDTEEFFPTQVKMEAPDHNSNYIDEGISGISAPETPNNDVGSHHGEKEGNNFMDGTGCDDGISALASRSLYDDSMVLEPLETVTNVKMIPNKSTGPCLLNTEGKSSEGKEFSCDKVTKDDQEIRNAIRAAELRLRATESPVRRELFHSSIQSSSGLSHSDEEVICLSDTEEFFPTQIKMESPDHNSDYIDEGISAPETPNYNVGSHHGEKEGNNFMDFTDWDGRISSLRPGNPHNDSVDHEGSEMRMSLNVAKKQPNKSIGPCRFTPKGRSPAKGNKGKEKIQSTLACSRKAASSVPENRGASQENLTSGPRTPGKKKSRTDDGSVVVPATPKSLKRKPVQKNLVWPTNVAEDFVSECVKKKNYMQIFLYVPLHTWKDVAKALHAKGHINISWDLCRAKYEQMHNFFVNTALKLGGMIGTSKWTHFEQFLKIHDIPSDVDLPPNLEIYSVDQNNRVCGVHKPLWSECNTTLLLDCYKIMKDKFTGTKSGVRHTVLYAQMASIMNQFEGVDVTGKQCHSHMDFMRSKFFEEHDGTRGTGQAPSKWQYFKQMKEIFEKDANVEAPCVASTADGTLSYTARGEEQAPSERSTRTRPPSAKVEPKKKQPPKKIYKSWTQEVQERQIEQRQALVDEVRLMRISFEQRSAQRMEMLKDLLKKF